jgi:hypothetical protein
VTTAASTHPHRTPLRRLDAVLGGPVWWATHLGAIYWLIPRVCELGSHWPLHLVTVVLLALTVRAGLSGLQVLRAARLDGASGDPTASRDVTVGWLGLLLASFFGAVIVAEWLPALFLDSCA